MSTWKYKYHPHYAHSASCSQLDKSDDKDQIYITVNTKHFVFAGMQTTSSWIDLDV